MSGHGVKLSTRVQIPDAMPAWKVRRMLDGLIAEFGTDAEVSLGADHILGRYLEVKRRPERPLQLVPRLLATTTEALTKETL